MWGHDFRPDYLRLGAVIEELGGPVVLALTATAAPPVRREIIEHLRLRDPAVIVCGFDRPNIHLAAELFDDERAKTDRLLDLVVDTPGPGLVYVATRRQATELGEQLRERGVDACAYHAGLKRAEREQVHEAFSDGDVRVVVATVAFGMGIDKPDVRFVFHYAVSESLDAYYQEIGRSGRDGAPAEARLLHRPQDVGLRRFFAASGHVGEDEIAQVAAALAEREGPVGLDELRERTELSASKLVSAVSRLEAVGAVRLRADGAVAPADDVADAVDPVMAAAEAEEARRRMDDSRVAMMRAYAETRECRRERLLSYFGEPFAGPCGHCDNCEAGLVAPDETEQPFAAGARVAHREWGEGLVMSYRDGKVTVLFDAVGYKTLLLEAVRDRGLLAPAD